MARYVGSLEGWIRALAMLILAAGSSGLAVAEAPATAATQAVSRTQPAAGELTPHHAELARLAGRWEATLSYWIAPGLPPQEGKAIVDRELILDGRFLRSSWSVDLSGRIYEAIVIEGFDPVSGSHTTAWIENGGLPPLHFVGECQPGGRTWSSRAEFTDAQTGTPRRLKAVATLTAPNRFTYHQSIVGPDDEGPRLEVVMLRSTPR